MKPQIISLGYAVPEHSYSQEEIFNGLGYPHQFRRIFIDSGIEKRHFWVPLPDMMRLSWQEQQERYLAGAITLSMKAALLCLDGRDTKDIGLLVFCSCTGLAPGPTVGHYLIKPLGLREDIYITNIVSQGCEGGGFPGLKRATDFTTATGRQALVIACELSSCAYYPEPFGQPDPENDYELLRANAIFADCVSAALVGFDDNLKHPYVVDSEAHTNTDYMEDLGFKWRNGRLRVLMSKSVPSHAAEVAGKAIEVLLSRHKLEPKDITYWVVHAAGMKVLNLIGDRLGIELEFSKKFLRENGNCSSATVGGIAKLLIQEVEPKNGEFLAVVTVGPGMTGGCTILKFGE